MVFINITIVTECSLIVNPNILEEITQIYHFKSSISHTSYNSYLETFVFLLIDWLWIYFSNILEQVSFKFPLSKHAFRLYQPRGKNLIKLVIEFLPSQLCITNI